MVSLSRVSSIPVRTLCIPIRFSNSPSPPSLSLSRTFAVSASMSSAASVQFPSLNSNRWKPMCLYYSQGKCTMMGDATHLERFDHSSSWKPLVQTADADHTCDQKFDYFLVLDLEGKVEILEFPVVMVNAKSMEVMDIFHRFVRPSEMSEQRINQYIEGKYGKIGVDRVWHDTAIPFYDVLQQFEAWMTQNQLWEKEIGGPLRQAAFVTCGNWDLKTKVPQQCKVANMELPLYFMEWINIKDVYLNFYNRRATGMMSMMKQLQIPLLGSHHLGIDDSKNIARVLQHMLADGALIQITARRNPASQNVDYLFKNRI
ncbi:Exonuclease, RNase T/DNA polymerase III [Dillenia turbinata]|uniref:Exonuclease, RNase T/DNA polymerase III n=1 Tax=Dillenia turbinata TaxID=194707 RepID=A0AAN8VQJ5_9MAGN